MGRIAMTIRNEASRDGGSPKEKRGKLGRKEYEKQLAKLHVELVKLQ